MSALLAPLFLVATASANPHNSFSALVGTSTAFDGDPASLRLSLRGDVGIAHNDTLGASVLVPLTISTTGESGLGFSSQQTVFELPVSFRGTIFPHGKVRFYADAGAGLAWGTSRFDGWFIDATETNAVFMTRTALGLELGPAESLSFVVEPASWRTFYTPDRARSAYGLMLGLVVPI